MADLARTARKFVSVFGVQADASLACAQALAAPNLADKVLAYALNFATQFLEVGRAEISEMLLSANARTRAERGLPDDPKAVLLLPQVLSACADSRNAEVEALQRQLRLSNPSEQRAALSAKLADAEANLQPTLQALQRAEAAAGAAAASDALSAMVSGMQLHSSAALPPTPGSASRRRPASASAGGGVGRGVAAAAAYGLDATPTRRASAAHTRLPMTSASSSTIFTACVLDSISAANFSSSLSRAASICWSCSLDSDAESATLECSSSRCSNC